jgi:tetratricopeptide (TPR) repeat protein
LRGILFLLLFTALTMSAQRAKPAFDPDTREGLLIQHIQQETDAKEKLHYMEQFAAQFPADPAAAWVYDQLQPALFEAKDYDAAMRIGALRLTLEPANLEAAKIALRSAEALRKPEQMVEWSAKVWPLASTPETKDTRTYADFCAYTAAELTTDPKTRLGILEQIEHRSPSSEFLRNVAVEYYQIFRQLGDEEKAIAMAERALATDPDNGEMMLAVAEYQFHKGNARYRQEILTHSARVVELLEKAPRPAGWKDEDWEKKRNQMLGMAYYIGGMSASLLSNWAKADMMLRPALALIKDNPSQEAAALYHLGMANYRLAEAGSDKTRPVDAVKFLRRCAAMKGPFQEQAAQYVESIRSAYSLP